MRHPKFIKFTSLLVLVLLASSSFLGFQVGFAYSLYGGNTPLGQTKDGTNLGSTNTSSPLQFSNVSTQLPPILAKAKSLGMLNPSTQMSVKLILPTRNLQGLNLFLKEAYNPDSPMYHHFLTPQQFNLLYGPDQAEVQALTSYLESKGLQLTLQRPTPSVLEARGNAQQIEDAFKTKIVSFQYGDKTFYSPTSLAQLPSQFANINMIYGLESFDSQTGGHGAVPLYKTLNATVSNPGQTPGNFLYYSPSEIQHSYNATSLYAAGYNGSGITIAIVDAYGDPYIQQELDNFSAKFGLPSTTVQVTCVDGPCDYTQGIYTGWSMEVALDVEWAHAMAPAATIDLYIGSDSGQALFDAVQQAASNTSTSIISMSWGIPENDIGSSAPVSALFGENYPWLDQVLQQAAAEGITAFASSGDWGAYDQSFGQNSPYGGAIYPSTDPYVTGVGGTTLYMNTTGGYYQFPYSNATGSYGNETAWSWNNFYDWGTGGGYSTIFGQPAWQGGPGVQQTGQRGAPDISWDADVQTGVLVSVYDEYTNGYDYYIVGGTSVGSPSLAGSLALLEQKTGHRLGLVNPALYSILRNQSEYSRAFHDVTTGNNNPHSATDGWDQLTGVGSPNLGELANYLAPSGSLRVSVQNDFSSQLGKSYAYGSTVNLTARVTYGGTNVTSGTVDANITSPSGSLIATNVPFTYNSTQGVWVGNCAIASTDTPGEWSVKVLATNGSLTGRGYTTFSVGDGITIYAPYYASYHDTSAEWYTPPFFQMGDTIQVSAAVDDSSGAAVTSGSYFATFNLNSPSGTQEGRVSLAFNSGDELWEGAFTIPSNVSQGSWVLTVSGNDSNGNLGSTYSWLNVGLDVFAATDEPTYVLGDAIQIIAYPSYVNGTEAVNGSFSATVSSGATALGTVPMSFNSSLDVWTGTFQTSGTDPMGFYKINVNGNDGSGNSGSYFTVARVAPYHLSVQTTFSSSEIAVNSSSSEFVSAKVTYPNGSVVKVGNIEAFVSLQVGAHSNHSSIVATIESGFVPLTYNATKQSFVGEILHSVNPMDTLIGNYTVSIEAFDPAGNYGNATTSFVVKAVQHSAITISSNADFTSSNGVIQGNGSYYNPFVIAGWNTTSIKVSGGLNASYELFNNWVKGSSGDGITLNTPNSTGASVIYDYTESNAGNGLYANNVSAGFFSGVIAIGNTKNGIVVANDSQAYYGAILYNLAFLNGQNGIVVENDSSANVFGNAAFGNPQNGILVESSPGAWIYFNVATQSAAGIRVTGSNYDETVLFLNTAIDNYVGILIDGSGQTITNDSQSPSYAVIEANFEIGNKIGIQAQNQAIAEVLDNYLISNSLGVSTQDSLPIITENTVTGSAESGIKTNGLMSSNLLVQFDLGDGVYNFSSAIYYNWVVQNGNSLSESGISVNNANNTILYGNFAAGNGDDGEELNNVTQSVIMFDEADYNAMNGFEANNVSYSYFAGLFATGNMKGGIVVNGVGSGGNGIEFNDMEMNMQSGVELFGGSSGNLVANNTILNNALNNPLRGFGVLVNGSATNGVYNNTISYNYAGIGLINSQNNTAENNTISYNTYGIYLLNAPGSVYSENTFSNNSQDVFTAIAQPPSVTVEEQGLASGVTWSVTFNGVTQTITTPSVTFSNLTAGNTYNVSVAAGSLYVFHSWNSNTSNLVVSNASSESTTVLVNGPGALIAEFSVPLDNSFTPAGVPTTTTLQSMPVLNVTYVNNLQTQFTGIVWFEVENNVTGQTVMIVASSLSIGSGQSSSAFLGLSTLAPGSYKAIMFVTTASGVVISPTATVPVSVGG